MADKRDRVDDDVQGVDEAAPKKLKVEAPEEPSTSLTPATAPDGSTTGTNPEGQAMEGCDILDVAATQPASQGPATEPATTAPAAAKPAEAPPAAAATAGPSGGGATAHSETGLKTGREAEGAVAGSESAAGTAAADDAPSTGAEAMEVQEGVAAPSAEDGAAPTPEAAGPAKDEPVKVGYKTFDSGSHASDYFHHLSSNLPQEQNLNEYEEHMLLELLKAGHPHAAQKLEGGVSGVQLRQHRMEGTRGTVCFHVMRPDGTCEDFSVWKCLAGLFPAWSKTASRPNPKTGGGGRGRGGGGRRGRGRGRGRGRARGGRK